MASVLHFSAVAATVTSDVLKTSFLTGPRRVSLVMRSVRPSTLSRPRPVSVWGRPRTWPSTLGPQQAFKLVSKAAWVETTCCQPWEPLLPAHLFSSESTRWLRAILSQDKQADQDKILKATLLSWTAKVAGTVNRSLGTTA